MADMHIIAGDGKGNYRIVAHFDVPDANNALGVNYRDALVNSGLLSVSVLPDGDGTEGTIDATEKAALANGSKFERVVSAPIDGPGTTNASRVTMLQDRYPVLETQAVDDLKARLKFFGHNQAAL